MLRKKSTATIAKSNWKQMPMARTIPFTNLRKTRIPRIRHPLKTWKIAIPVVSTTKIPRLRRGAMSSRPSGTGKSTYSVWRYLRSVGTPSRFMRKPKGTSKLPAWISPTTSSEGRCKFHFCLYACSLKVLTKFPVMRKMLMYLFWIYIVLKVKQIADYDRGVTKNQLLVSLITPE